MPAIPPQLDRALRVARVDRQPKHEQPRPALVVLATVVAIVGSLLADALLVALGKAVFPSTSHYQHYAFGDYSTLTIIGVVVACIGWPIVTRLTSEPRWLFSRLAVLVSAVLLIPDVALLAQGDSAEAVLVLVLMHLAIAVVTYQVLIRVAPVRAARRRTTRVAAR
jgi:hypothetical protein